MTADPEDLIQEARGGDAAALGRLLELYRRYLALLARVHIGQRLQGKADASDIVQEAFLQAHRNFGRFRGATEAQLVGWLRQILAAREILCIAPEARKARAVQATVEGPVSPAVPASILRTHPRAHLYLDTASASLLRPPPP